jgi:hypothetical protein
MRLRLIATVAVGSVLALASIAQAQDKDKKVKRDRNRIAREELVEAAERFPDLYDAIRSLRAHFLAPNNRGVRTTGVGERDASSSSSSGGSYGSGGSNAANAIAVVYIDGRRMSDPNAIKGLRTLEMEEVRYLNPNEAGQEYGLGHEGGAVLIKTYQEKKP